MDMDHERTFSDRDLYLAWAASKARAGHPISMDLYMDLLNEGYLTVSDTKDHEIASLHGLRLETM
jgi:hypothetical protein